MEGIFNKRIHWDKSEVEGVAVPGIELSVRVVPHSAFQTEDSQSKRHKLHSPQILNHLFGTANACSNFITSIFGGKKIPKPEEIGMDAA